MVNAAHGLVWVGGDGHGVTILAYPRLMRNPEPAPSHPHHTRKNQQNPDRFFEKFNLT